VYFDTWDCQLNWTNEQDSKNVGMSPDSYIMPANKRLREKVANDQAINMPKILNFVK
jgi:predicted ATP-grasp superfamily ATP-dependent carboligase